MKKMKCIAPRRAVNLMKQFVNDACDLFIDCEYTYVVNPKDPIQNWKFENRISTKKLQLFIHKGDSFAVNLPYGETLNKANESEYEITYNFNELYEIPSKLFRGCWSGISPTIKGFADITISLLHELGHLEAHDSTIDYTYEQRMNGLIEIHKKADSLAMANAMYFLLPNESAATEWAIKWLSDPQNRKIAKAFEKKFFACFE